MPPSVKAALFQLQPALGEPRANLRTLVQRVEAAKADLCVFPELFLTGYFNRDLLRQLAEPLDGPLVRELRGLARRTGSHVVAGMPRAGEQRGVVHNSSVLATPEGEVHAYDKVYLPSFSVFEEDLYFGEGHRLEVARTSLGKIGMCICYDLFFPEVTKALALQGADVITCISASPTISRTYFEQVLPARAIETTSFLLFVNHAGPQDQLAFWGGSKVYGPRGDLQASGPLLKPARVTASLDLEEVAVARRRRPLLRDTRPELVTWLRDAAEARAPRELRVLEALHGGLTPWLVAGLRMGKAARHALAGDGRAPERIEAVVLAPEAEPARAVLDGVQLGAGCTPGRGTLRAEPGEEVEARFAAGRRAVRVRVRPEAAKRFEARGEERELALWVYGLPEEELLEVRAA